MPLPGGFSKVLEGRNSSYDTQYAKYFKALTRQIKRPIIQLNASREQDTENKGKHGQQI